MTKITRRQFGLAGTAAAAALTTPAIVRGQAAMTVKFASFTPEMSLVNRAIMAPFLERVRDESGGAFDFQIFPGGTLGRNPAQQLRLVQDGIAEMAFVVPSYMPGAFDGYNVSQLPLGGRSATEGSMGLWRAYETGNLTDPDGARIVGVFTNGPNMVHANVDMASMDDVAGRKLRVAGDVQTEIARALGANPIGQIPISQVAETMSRGVIEAALSDWSAMSTFRVLEVADTHIDHPMGMVANMIVINARTYDAMPADAREAFDRYSGEWFANLAGGAFDAVVDATAAEAAAEASRTIITPSPEEAAAIDDRLAPVVEGWVGEDAGRAALVEAFEAGIEEGRAVSG